MFYKKFNIYLVKMTSVLFLLFGFSAVAESGGFQIIMQADNGEVYIQVDSSGKIQIIPTEEIEFWKQCQNTYKNKKQQCLEDFRNERIECITNSQDARDKIDCLKDFQIDLNYCFNEVESNKNQLCQIDSAFCRQTVEIWRETCLAEEEVEKWQCLHDSKDDADEASCEKKYAEKYCSEDFEKDIQWCSS